MIDEATSVGAILRAINFRAWLIYRGPGFKPTSFSASTICFEEQGSPFEPSLQPGAIFNEWRRDAWEVANSTRTLFSRDQVELIENIRQGLDLSPIDNKDLIYLRGKL